MDWSKIKAEYVSGACSYQAIADKYGVSYTQVKDRGRAEGWVADREEFRRKTAAKIADKISDRRAERAACIHEAADLMVDTLLQIAMSMHDTGDPELINSQAFRQYVAALKDLQEIQGAKKDKLDLEEQQARIEKLRQREDQEDNRIIVEMEGVEEFGV